MRLGKIVSYDSSPGMAVVLGVLGIAADSTLHAAKFHGQHKFETGTGIGLEQDTIAI